jgi:DNA-binding response OmpR family regulator
MAKRLVLIIEDEEPIANVLGQVMEEAGHEVEVIHSGDTALARLFTVTPDFVVLDLHLPGTPGTEILRQIRTDPRLAETRVAVITGHRDLAYTVKDEADWVIQKPITFGRVRELARCISPDAPPDPQQEQVAGNLDEQ